jgi:DNA polymerase
MGTFATKLLREDPAGIRATRGRVEIRTLGSRTVRLLPLHHPDAVLYEPALLDVLRADLALLPDLLARPAPPQPEPPRPEPEDPPPPPAPAAEDRDAPDPDAGPDQLGLF